MNMAKIAAAATITTVAFVPSLAHAASDPMNPDCPKAAGILNLARKVDVFNVICAQPSEICGTLLKEISTDAQEFPGIIVQQGGPQLYFDPEIVFKTIDFYTPYPHVFDCDPENPDCDGQTTDLSTIRDNISATGTGIEVLMGFPTSNIYLSR